MATGALTLRIGVPGLRLTGTYSGPSSTDTSNELGGRIERGTGTLSFRPDPTTYSPPVIPEHRYDKAIAYPVPTMVNGRPT